MMENWTVENYFSLGAVVIDSLTFLAVVVGGVFALLQWRMQIKQKRVEMARELMSTIRDDEDIMMVSDIIDWDDGISYDGKFSVQSSNPFFKEMDEDELFAKIDRTLSHFSYICYLNSMNVLKKNDMAFFEYDLRRLTDNEHICNYLFSLHHWSNSLCVQCPYKCLIEYAIKRKYLDKSFVDLNSKRYICFLKL